MIDPAPPAAPLPDGLEATGADRAGGGFEELWRAYEHRQKKAEAKAAYLKASPDAELHQRMVDAARKWFASWAAQGKADAPRFTLAKWIEREEYECEPPTAYKPKGQKKPHPATKSPSGDNVEKPDFTFHPNVLTRGRIVRTELDISEDDGARLLTVYYQTRDYGEVDHLIVCESPDEREDRTGKEDYRKLLQAVDLATIDDPDDLVGRHVALTVTHVGGFVSVEKETPSVVDDVCAAA